MIAFLFGLKPTLFIIDLVIHYALLAGIVWSVASYQNHIWPPPKKRSWQYTVTWFCFYVAFGINGVFVFLDWNSWILRGNYRFAVGIPMTIIGGLFVFWGIRTLGIKNTSGLKNGFVKSGPYRYTRNPQYLGDMLLFAGLIVISNSVYILVANSLLILIFLITPMAEERWLEEQYGKQYLEYKNSTPRFL